MRSRLRVIARILFPSVIALGLAAAVLGPITGEPIEVPLVASVTVAGAAIAYEVIRVARKSGRLAWQDGTTLWAGRRGAPAVEVPDPLGHWESLLAAARVDQDRSRRRFLRRLAPLTRTETQPLVDAMAAADPEEFDRLVSRFVAESRLD
ncbi:MAG TPA: hypothetical protein VF246_07030 [Acidimicrobiia bacterium]